MNITKKLCFKMIFFMLGSGYWQSVSAQVVAPNLPNAPEIGTGFEPKAPVYAQHFLAATANAYATDAAYDMLKQGGSAVDAAIAAQMVLTLTEPQSSGIGGGAFLMFYDAKHQLVKAYDGRETAPRNVDSTLFQTSDGKALDFYTGAIGGRSVGVPGVLKMLWLAHQQHGVLPWKRLFAPAIRLARDGFVVSRRLHALIVNDKYLKQDPTARAYFYDEAGAPRAIGSVLKNPELAKVFRILAQHGISEFYQGRIARAMVDKVRSHANNPGMLALQDLSMYKAHVRKAICTPYRQWIVCGMPPPSSGGIAIAQMLGILEATSIADEKPMAENGLYYPSQHAVHWFSEAGRLAFADRNYYVADPDFVALPGGSYQALVAPNYLKQRAALIKDQSMKKALPGNPLQASMLRTEDKSPELPSTSHLSIVDRFGHVVSMTSSIEDAFGSRQMVSGFLLNNQLTDFSFVSQEQGVLVANRVEPMKRPRSSMSPVLVFKKTPSGRLGDFYLASGSPGGSAIINYVAKNLIASLAWKLPPEDVVNMPNFGSRNSATELEKGLFSDDYATILREKFGHDIKFVEFTSGIQMILRVTSTPNASFFKNSQFVGVADPRREGTVRGR